METVAIGLYLIVGLFAAPVFCFLLSRFIRNIPLLAVPLWYGGIAVALVFALDLVLVAIFGGVTLRGFFGPIFVFVHTTSTLLAAPAVACGLLLRGQRIARWWPGIATLCWVIGAFAIFYQYNVMESLYGIDGIGGPYS